LNVTTFCRTVTFFSVFTIVFCVFISSAQRSSSSLQGHGSLAELKQFHVHISGTWDL